MLKRERVYRTKYATLEEARTDIFTYMELFHNPRMRRRVSKRDQNFLTLSQPSVISA